VSVKHDFDATRRSWNIGTRNHNAHKGDQAAFLREGGDVLFPEELELLGDLRGRRLVHLQCNSGQDSLCLARRGADVTGVDLSDEAIAFARRLSAESGIAARFVEAELLGWLASTEERFDLAFSSYGAVGWLPDLDAWARGVARVLTPGGRLVYVEFHPLVWSLGDDGRLTGDDYFRRGPYLDPVSDYVFASGEGLGRRVDAPEGKNVEPATSWQWGLGEILTAIAGAGLRIEAVREWPHANGARFARFLEAGADRRFQWPEGRARLPLMMGITAVLPPGSFPRVAASHPG
jgi:SAM-dependent methyltransferase